MTTCKKCPFVKVDDRGAWKNYSCQLGEFDFGFNISDDYLYPGCPLPED